MRVTRSLGLCGLLCSSATLVHAIDVDLDSSDSIISAGKTIVQHILSIYDNNTGDGFIPGLLPEPYYWWEGGKMFDSLINYWAASGDNSIVQTIQDGMIFQIGPDNNYMPPNQTKNLGNDDQAAWALAAMTAAEKGFPSSNNTNVTWIQLAQTVFNNQVARWDDGTCGGGLRWQIFTFNNGYNYKNSASTGSFLELAARLAVFTGNSTYGDWALKAAEWASNVGLYDASRGVVYDGTDVTGNCSDITRIPWTQNSGLFLSGFAAMSNFTSGTKQWNDFSLFSFANETFLNKDALKEGKRVLYEAACAPRDNCNVDQLSYKAALVRGLANARDRVLVDGNVTTGGMLAGSVDDNINTILRDSAQGAAAQCSGGENGTTCGSNWASSTWDGTQGIGQDLSALEVLLANLPARQLNTANSTTTSANAAGLNGTSTQQGNGSTTGSAASETSNGSASELVSYSALGSLTLVGFFALLL